MESSQPFCITHPESLRGKLARAERDGTLMGQVWASVRRRAQARPEAFPWFAPLVAVVTQDAQAVENARAAIRSYVSTFDKLGFTTGLHFHFWCFAFPHARWSLYFQWLQSLGAWQPEEERRLAQQIISFQFVNFFSGLRTKPEPECVDNQTMSLALSNGLVGHLFRRAPLGSSIAQRMYDDGARRLPSMLGGMPQSGYSGEGSTYQDFVVGPSVPFMVELLERAERGEWFARSLPPNGGSAESVTRMIAREWMPGGLLLPWDHYGYQLPCRSTIAYAGHRTGDPWFAELLENHAGWSHDVNIGWGSDDLVWSLIWWPERRGRHAGKVFPSWREPEIGAAVVSDDASLYLMQMWDPSTPVCPSRAHVNPNAIILSAWGSPLTVDGVPSRECTAFNFDDTWREVGYMDMHRRKFNFGSGCGGSHSVIIVDGWEGMRAGASYQQARLVEFDEAGSSVAADVTPIYRERWPDACRVVRRSRLCEGRFWLIEDLVQFEGEHDVAARWFFRPDVSEAARGFVIDTAEGVRLHFLPLVGPDVKTMKAIKGYPDRLDGGSVMVDFRQRGSECRWLWLAYPEQTREVREDISDGWQAMADADESLDYPRAVEKLRRSTLRLPFTQPAFMLSDVPVTRRWWYRRTISPPRGRRWWLRLPRQLGDARLWADGHEIDLQPHRLRMQLMAPHVEMPAANGDVEVCVSCTASVSQLERTGDIAQSFDGRPAILVPSDRCGLRAASYRDRIVTVETAAGRWRVAHELMA